MVDPQVIIWVGGGMTAAVLLAVPATSSGPMTCPTCGYPLVDPEDPVCPQCTATKPIALNTESWDLAQTLSRRRLLLHVTAIVLAGLLAVGIWLATATLPATWTESGEMRLEPESGEYRLSLRADVHYRQERHSAERFDPVAELRLSVAR